MIKDVCFTRYFSYQEEYNGTTNNIGWCFCRKTCFVLYSIFFHMFDNLEIIWEWFLSIFVWFEISLSSFEHILHFLHVPHRPFEGTLSIQRYFKSLFWLVICYCIYTFSNNVLTIGKSCLRRRLGCQIMEISSLFGTLGHKQSSSLCLRFTNTWFHDLYLKSSIDADSGLAEQSRTHKWMVASSSLIS